jgi:flavodoxin
MNKDLGPVVGEIAGKKIRANQLLRRGYDWRQGYGTPSDGHDTSSEHAPVKRLTADEHALIVFWSRSGSTELLASKIAALTGADVLEVVLAKPYPANYQLTLARAEEERLGGRPPKAVTQLPDLEQYDTIYLGFQTWAMTMSQPMQGFLQAEGKKIAGKTVAPFLSQGSYGVGNGINVLKNLLGSGNKVLAPLVINGNEVDRHDDEIAAWVKAVKKQNA